MPNNQEWPPKWVNQTGIDGPMTLTKGQFLKYLGIIYLMGVKKLGGNNLADLFSANPILREEWLCKTTTRRNLQRFLRQASKQILTPYPTLNLTQTSL